MASGLRCAVLQCLWPLTRCSIYPFKESKGTIGVWCSDVNEIPHWEYLSYWSHSKSSTFRRKYVIFIEPILNCWTTFKLLRLCTGCADVNECFMCRCIAKCFVQNLWCKLISDLSYIDANGNTVLSLCRMLMVCKETCSRSPPSLVNSDIAHELKVTWKQRSPAS